MPLAFIAKTYADSGGDHSVHSHVMYVLEAAVSDGSFTAAIQSAAGGSSRLRRRLDMSAATADSVEVATFSPTPAPSPVPTSQPSPAPSTPPSPSPTAAPSVLPLPSPTAVPSTRPSPSPTAMPMPRPTEPPTPVPPTNNPTSAPTFPPSAGDTSENDSAVVLLVVVFSSVVAVCVLVCCVIGICYVAKCACFAKNAQVTAAPSTAVVAEMATPMQPMVTLQPQNAKSGSVPTNAPVQVLQPQMLQPQGVTQPQVLVPQQGSVRTTQVLVPQQGSL